MTKNELTEKKARAFDLIMTLQLLDQELAQLINEINNDTTANSNS